MLSVALARAAAEACDKVLFTTYEDMTPCAARSPSTASACGLRFFTTPRLLVIDEVGYRILDEEARSLLFEVINARYLKGSIITTSHVGIGPGPSGSATPCSPPPPWTGSCTAASSSLPAERKAAVERRAGAGGRGPWAVSAS